MSHQPIRYCDDLGMYTFSRGYDTCLWRTQWCAKHCYWKKYRSMGWSTDQSDEADNSWWKNVSAADFAYELFKRDCLRFRFSMKGEIWTAQDDIVQVVAIATLLPRTQFWIPTRAWRDRDTRLAIQRWQKPNMHVMASIDPTTTELEVAMLREDGWSLFYVGDNGDPGQFLLGESGLEEKITKDMFRCPKTWQHKLGHCVICEEGCFKKSRVEVHLKKHR